MAVHIKADKTIAKLLPVIELIGREGILPRKRKHRCSSCYRVGHPTKGKDTEHVLFELPAGTLLYICRDCGAVAIYDGDADLQHELEPKHWQGGNLLYARALRQAREREGQRGQESD